MSYLCQFSFSALYIHGLSFILLYSSDLEVAVVYYRTAYGPEHYSSEKVSR
jgi:hypothetical protein